MSKMSPEEYWEQMGRFNAARALNHDLARVPADYLLTAREILKLRRVAPGSREALTAAAGKTTAAVARRILAPLVGFAPVEALQADLAASAAPSDGLDQFQPGRRVDVTVDLASFRPGRPPSVDAQLAQLDELLGDA